MPSPSVFGVPHADGHVHIVLVSPDPPRRKEVILAHSCLRARGNSLKHPPLNVGPPLGHCDGDGKLLPWGLNRITHQTGDLHVTQLLPGTGPPLRHFQG